jgi:2-dehydro-3-deoxyphosphogluconate aldolase/(4S)-4-hydroxy-2-oxoglutarate aldolase
MSKAEQLQRVQDAGIVAVVRAPGPDGLVDVIRALAEGGVTVSEVTLTVPKALDVISEAKKELGDSVLLGAGTVLNAETCRAALEAGAEFIVSPVVNLQVIELCQRQDKIVMPGAFTPTEILTAWEAGADIVKVFPAEVVGPAFFRAMRGPLPKIRLMPTGGVDLTTAAEFLKAGACCLGIGGQLVDPKRVAARDFDGLRDLATKYVEIVRKTRSQNLTG